VFKNIGQREAALEKKLQESYETLQEELQAIERKRIR